METFLFGGKVKLNRDKRKVEWFLCRKTLKIHIIHTNFGMVIQIGKILLSSSQISHKVPKVTFVHITLSYVHGYMSMI